MGQGSGPFGYGFYFLGVGLHLPGLNDEAQKRDGADMELACLWFYKQAVFKEPLKNCRCELCAVPGVRIKLQSFLHNASLCLFT